MSPYIVLNHQHKIYLFEKLLRTFKVQIYIFLILIFFLSYFFQVISLNSSSYSIQDMENKAALLKINIQKLEATLADSQQQPQNLDLIETKLIVYIDINQSNVAVVKP